MDLFVYGTLRDPDLMAAVAGPGVPAPVDASLPDFQVRPLAGDVIALIEPGRGHAKGVLWRGLDNAQAARVDLYARAYGYAPETQTIIAGRKSCDATVYMPPPGSISAPEDWFLTDWRRRTGEAAVLAAQEIYAHDPLPTPDALNRMRRMIEMRGWAQARAHRQDAVATVRHAARPGDATIDHADPPKGEFFRLRAFQASHLQFDGTRSPALRREVFLGIDAALVLPYDPATDRVLLVEQCRMGALMRGDPNPWVLEPIAGMVDPMETPEEAALRETREEAGITQIALTKINAFYPSPGSSTDYFHAYLGLCKIPDATSYTGGLDTEGEDLRLHPIPYDQAMELVDAGEITAGPLMMMLYWLGLHRDRLRTATS